MDKCSLANSEVSGHFARLNSRSILVHIPNCSSNNSYTHTHTVASCKSYTRSSKLLFFCPQYTRDLNYIWGVWIMKIGTDARDVYMDAKKYMTNPLGVHCVSCLTLWTAYYLSRHTHTIPSCDTNTQVLQTLCPHLLNMIWQTSIT